MEFIQRGNHILPFLWMRGEPEEALRRELAQIDACGIGAVCLEARPHPDFAGPGWWNDVDIVLDEAKRRGMKVWILDDAHFPTGYANGRLAQYPRRRKLYLRHNTADVAGGRGAVTLPVWQMLKPRTSWMDMGAKPDAEEQKNNRLAAVVALRLCGGAPEEQGAIDLTGRVRGNRLECELPAGMWRVFVVYETHTDGGRSDYINVIDPASVDVLIEAVYQPHYRRYADEFGKTIMGFFSDEPGFGNTTGFAMDETIGKKDMALPWTAEAAGLMAERLGEDWKLRLPWLWADSAAQAASIETRYVYMDIVTRLYARHFSGRLGSWCRNHGVEYIGHIIEDNGQHSRLGCGAGHYFRAMSGQHMAGIDVIGGQMIPGMSGLGRYDKADGDFFHYVLGRLATSDAQLDPKKRGRAMVELFGAYGWQFGVRDMKWVLDHLLAQGLNTLVPHAFSMAAYPDPDCPPHFYAAGNNPQFSHFADLMRYANRACDLLSGGRHAARVAVLYHGEAAWLGESMPMSVVARVLQRAQVDFDIVPLDALVAAESRVEAGVLCINAQRYGALVVPWAQYLPADFERFLQGAGVLPVLFAGGAPSAIAGGNAFDPGGHTNCRAVQPQQLVAEIEALGLREIWLDASCGSVWAYHYSRPDGEVLLLRNESLYEPFDGRVRLAVGGGPLAVYDAMADEAFALETEADADGGVRFRLRLEPGECRFVAPGSAQAPYRPMADRVAECGYTLDLGRDWQVSAVRAIDYPGFGAQTHYETLKPYSDKNPDFSGIIRYEKSFELDTVPGEAWLCFEQVGESLAVWVNGQQAGRRLAPPYTLQVGGLLGPGANTLVAEVATTPHREMQTQPEPPFRMVFEPYEPTGIFGSVELRY